MELFILLALTYIFSFAFGYVLERVGIPWLFASLFLGLILSSINLRFFSQALSSPSFNFLANLGMLFLLFMIGFELDLKEILSLKKFIFFATFFIILFDATIGGILIHSFGFPLLISITCALSFATVGEAILLPILDEFKLIKTRLGATIIGIGTLDDIIEVITIVLATSLIGVRMKGFDPFITAFSLVFLFFLTFALIKLKKVGRTLRKTPSMEDLFLFSLFILFFFIAVGRYAESEAIGALLAGIGLRNFLPKKTFRWTEEGIRLSTYGIFAPIFFLWVGYSVSLTSIYLFPLLTFAIFLVSIFSKIFASMAAGFKTFGFRTSFLLGVGLSVRFSTGLVIAQLLLIKGLITQQLFSALIAASTLSTILVPIIFSFLLKRWKKKLRHTL